jgi:hypothetical protein
MMKEAASQEGSSAKPGDAERSLLADRLPSSKLYHTTDVEPRFVVIPPQATRFGFSARKSGGHMSRSMMLPELGLLLGATTADAARAEYRAAIVDDNILGKPTYSSRRKAEKHLYELYGLDPSFALFRVLRRFAGEYSESLPLLALRCAFCRDAQLRASFPLIEKIKQGEVLSRERMEAHLEAAFPQRYSANMKVGLAQNVNTTWTAAGHLKGRAIKRKTVPQPRVAASTYAMFAGYLLGMRAEILVSSVFVRLVGADPSVIVAHLSTAARNGWLRFRHAGGVMEIDFSGLLLPEEEALLHGAH